MIHTPDSRLVALDDPETLTVLLFGECRNEPLQAQLAVAATVRNRVGTGRWFSASTYRGVILRWAQYSCLWPSMGGKNFTRVMEFAETVQRVGGLHALTDPVHRQLAWVAVGTVSGDIHEDCAKGATHYYDDSIPPPAWARVPASEVLTYGPLHFWAHVA